MVKAWNLTPNEWSHVLLNGVRGATLASYLTAGNSLPWTEILLKSTEDSKQALDLGSGRGEHSAILALHGREPTLLDWSKESIDFSTKLFETLGIHGHFCQADMMQSLPFKNNSFDLVFSCGVFEYFTRKQIEVLLREASRVSRKRIIIMVPNALSLAYRIGKRCMEKTGTWYWGGEVPSYTLKPYFRRLGYKRIAEFSVASKHALNFLQTPTGETIKSLCIRVLRLGDHAKPALLRQGYLLVTIADKASGECQ